MKHAVRLAVAVGAALLAAGPALAIPAKPVTLQLKLPKKPVEPRPVMANPLTKGPLSLAVVDVRGAEDDAWVGVYRGNDADVYTWRATQPVMPAVAGFVTQLLTGWSIPLAPEAEFGLRFELARFAVVEKPETFGSTYLGEVRLRASFVDRSGRVLWTGESTGTSKRPGVDGRASMCNEALSVALRGAVAAALAAVKPDTDAPPAAEAASAPQRVVVEPEALLADLSKLKDGGMADDMLVSYVQQRKLSRPLTVDEILHWKSAGIPDAAIKAAAAP